MLKFEIQWIPPRRQSTTPCPSTHPQRESEEDADARGDPEDRRAVPADRPLAGGHHAGRGPRRRPRHDAHR